MVNQLAEYERNFSHLVTKFFFQSATKTVWISVEYRLAPEYKYPIWLDDASDVAEYIIQNKTSYGLISSQYSV